MIPEENEITLEGSLKGAELMIEWATPDIKQWWEGYACALRNVIAQKNRQA